MKPLLFPLLAGTLLACAQAPGQAQEFKEHLSKEFTPTGAVGSTTLAIYNVNGFIKVEGYPGNKVLLEIDKTISAKNQPTLELGKKEFSLQFEQKGDSLIVYIAEPFDSRPDRNRWNRENHRRIEYGYNLDFTVKIPYAMNLHASTVNHGDVVVNNVAGTLRVFNVNGAIALTNAKGTTELHTINGNVDANYLAVPSEKSTYYTLNGDIRVSYPASFSAELQFKSFNGSFFTDFADAEVLPTRVTRNQEGKGGGTVYKLNKDASIRIGKGGKTFRFETFNGNIYIKKQG